MPYTCICSLHGNATKQIKSKENMKLQQLNNGRITAVIINSEMHSWLCFMHLKLRGLDVLTVMKMAPRIMANDLALITVKFSG